MHFSLPTQKISLHGELADLPFQLGDPPGIVERWKTSASPPNAGKGGFSLRAPLSAPTFEKFRAQLVVMRVRAEQAGVIADAPEWEKLDRVVQVEAIRNAVERVGYDGKLRQLSVRFRPGAEGVQA